MSENNQTNVKSEHTASIPSSNSKLNETEPLCSTPCSASSNVIGEGYTWKTKSGETMVMGKSFDLTKELAYEHMVIEGVPFKDSQSPLRAYLEKSWSGD